MVLNLLSHRVWNTQGCRMQEFWLCLPKADAGWVLCYEKPWDTIPGMEEHSLRSLEMLAWRVPGPTGKTESSGSQDLGHPGTTGTLRRAENRVGAEQAGSGLGLKGKGAGGECSSCFPRGGVFGLLRQVAWLRTQRGLPSEIGHTAL